MPVIILLDCVLYLENCLAEAVPAQELDVRLLLVLSLHDLTPEIFQIILAIKLILKIDVYLILFYPGHFLYFKVYRVTSPLPLLREQAPCVRTTIVVPLFPSTVTVRLPDVRFGEPDEKTSGFRTFLCPVCSVRLLV